LARCFYDNTNRSGNGQSSMSDAAKTLLLERHRHDNTSSFVQGCPSVACSVHAFRPAQAWYDTSRGSVFGGRAACRIKDRNRVQASRLRSLMMVGDPLAA
jgi:hypothetical protein